MPWFDQCIISSSLTDNVQWDRLQLDNLPWDNPPRYSRRTFDARLPVLFDCLDVLSTRDHLQICSCDLAHAHSEPDPAGCSFQLPTTVMPVG